MNDRDSTPTQWCINLQYILHSRGSLRNQCDQGRVQEHGAWGLCSGAGHMRVVGDLLAE